MTNHTKLSVNINKIALIRNSRGTNNPNLISVAKDCERFGAQGITVHPRPDQRHVRYDDLLPLSQIVKTEFNIEGNPTQDFIKKVLQIRPAQVTLVPDSEDQLTSDHGWDTKRDKDKLIDLIASFKSEGIRVSIFLDANPTLIDTAYQTGADRIELYTGPYAWEYHKNREKAIAPYIETAKAAMQAGLGINAGHDLDLDNLSYFYQNIPGLLEVSIGHALVCDALYLGLENTIKLYLNRLNPTFEMR
ncbi:MAG: pyridoxine 5'-phosphate synthase [Bacteroidetes bacterium]|nr:pyridoxine 5'-phosphate synthase [Bacteroidota bacterium]